MDYAISQIRLIMQIGVKLLLGATILFTGLFGALFVGWNVLSLFALGPVNFLSEYIGLAPLILLIPITAFSLLFLTTKERFLIRLMPSIIGMIAIFIGFEVKSFQNDHPYFGFYHHKNELEAVVKLIELGVIAPDSEGYAHLPNQYAHLSLGHVVLISDTLDAPTYYFMVGMDDFDPSTWGYLYRPNGSEPPTTGMCQKWGLIQPSTPNWFTCFYGEYDRERLYGTNGLDALP